MTKTSRVLVEDVYKDYPDPSGGIKRVLGDIDLRISAGEFVTVVGPSGCGKSTLLRLIVGEEKPTSGKVFVDGQIVSGPNRDKGIVYQRYSLFPHKTALENIMFGLELEGFSLLSRPLGGVLFKKRLQAYSKKAVEYMKRVGLDVSDTSKKPHQLSGGMKQRVAIAKAMIMDPKVLLMDEPFGALDHSTRRAMQSFIIEKWKENKQTILFVTHDLEEAIFLGTRIIVLSQHYSADSPVNGAKIVLDKSIPFSQSHDFKLTPEFAALEQQIRRDGLDPNHKQHVKDFDLSHPDSFRTVTPEEWRR